MDVHPQHNQNLPLDDSKVCQMESNTPVPSADLYALLNISSSATEEEIQKSFKALSNSYHPDKLQASYSPEDREHIQHIFLEIKRAKDILIDPVLRLAYDDYGDEGVDLIRRIQQHRREQETRRDVNANVSRDEEDEEDEDEEMEVSLYTKIERLMKSNRLEAKHELQRFMAQHDYHSNLTEQSQVQLACNVEFPPVVDLKAVYFHGRDYLKYAQQSIVDQARAASPNERDYFKQRLKQEQGLVDYQINRIRESQKGSVGFTLSSLQPRKVATMSGESVRPKWSMAIGTSTDALYPGVAEVAKLVGKDIQDEKRSSASVFINTVYQPVPDAQVNLTANLSNDQSHQFILGSARTLSDRSSYRYSLTFLPKSPMDTNLILNLKSMRQIKDIGLASGGISFGANGQFLQWHAAWEAVNGKENIHKTSAKVSMGVMQGNSLELSYILKSRKRTWLDDYLLMPKSFEATTVLGRFSKIEAMAHQEITTLASHPRLSFGFEHDMALGCWSWVWELSHKGSIFRVPIPVLHLGTITDPTAFYQRKFYYGMYCMLLQSLITDTLHDEKGERAQASDQIVVSEETVDTSRSKTNKDATQQLALMKSVAALRRSSEIKQNGLVILSALYFLEVKIGHEIQVASADVTTQLQFWVSSGRLTLPAIKKSNLLGFYDLRTDIKEWSRPHKWDWRIWKRLSRRSVANDQQPEPQIRVRYSFQQYVYEISVSDCDSLNLPSRRARLLGHADVLH